MSVDDSLLFHSIKIIDILYISKVRDSMPRKQKELYKVLENLRAELREKERAYGHDVIICTDDALEEMSKVSISRLVDFLAIPGLDHDFIENYAHLFLEVYHRFQKDDLKKVRVSKHASVVLDRYKDRLSDISKTNPNLYMGKIEKLRSFDLYDENHIEDLKSLLSLKKKSLSLPIDKEDTYEHLTTLYRYINKDYKDLGTYHLYLAYPYVEGLFKKDLFPIKAPLAYMPVKLERSRKNYQLIFDEEKDILYNRDLLLTLSKIEKTNLTDDTPELSNLSDKSIKDILIPFYEKHGLDIKWDQDLSFIPFHQT
jgi:hypothetical protein